MWFSTKCSRGFYLSLCETKNQLPKMFFFEKLKFHPFFQKPKPDLKLISVAAALSFKVLSWKRVWSHIMKMSKMKNFSLTVQLFAGHRCNCNHGRVFVSVKYRAFKQRIIDTLLIYDNLIIWKTKSCLVWKTVACCGDFGHGRYERSAIDVPRVLPWHLPPMHRLH